MAEVQLFAYGWATPVAAVVMSVTGCLLGILLTSKAPVLHGRRRFRLLVYAAIAVGMVGIWQAQVIALIGFAVAGSPVRYDPIRLAAGLGVGLLLVFAGMLLLGYGQPRRLRMLGAGVLRAAGIASTHQICAGAIMVNGTTRHEPRWVVAILGVAVAVALVAAGAGRWFVTGLAGLRYAFGAATGLGVLICTVHYTGMNALQVQLDTSSMPTVTGVNPILLVGVVALGTAVNVMLWYFTVGDSTVNDLEAIFVEPSKSVEIEPWLIKEVTSRVSVEVSTVDEDELPHAGPAPRPLGSRRSARITPEWQTVPAWGAPSWPVTNNSKAARPAAVAPNSRVGISPRSEASGLKR